MSHSVDLAHMLLGPITRVVGHDGDVHPRAAAAPLPGQSHYGRGAPERPDAARSPTRTTRGCCASSPRARAARSRRAARSSGPRARWRSTSTAPRARWAGTSSSSTSSQLYLAEDELHTGYRTVFGGDRFPYHGAFVPGSANGIGFEDLVVIEDYEFCRAIAEGRALHAGLRRGGRVGHACRRRCCARRSRAAGRTSCRCEGGS